MSAYRIAIVLFAGVSVAWAQQPPAADAPVKAKQQRESEEAKKSKSVAKMTPQEKQTGVKNVNAIASPQNAILVGDFPTVGRDAQWNSRPRNPQKPVPSDTQR